MIQEMINAGLIEPVLDREGEIRIRLKEEWK